MSSLNKRSLRRIYGLAAAIVAVSLVHYLTSTRHFWLHELLQRAYYIPILLAALWFGWRGGLLAAFFSGLLYLSHILLDWRSFPGYDAHDIEIVMFFAIGAICGVLADQLRKEHTKLEETASLLNVVNQQLQASFEQLRRADRLSALGELSAGLAHEIRNPLGSIEGAVHILRRPELPTATRHEFGELAQNEVNRLKGLVSHFLDFARPQAPRRKPTDILELLESVKLLAEETANISQVQVQVNPSSELPDIPIDAEQMKQVLLNLVLNAIQATRPGGRVRLGANLDGDSMGVFVSDEGIGIEPENLEKIFDPFFTTRAEGTGLGLSIAYQIVSAHGGHISPSSNTDGGMIFTVTLPLTTRGSTFRSSVRQGI